MHATVIVRLRRGDSGRVTGVAERVETGQKIAIRGLDNLDEIVASLLAASPPSAS